MLLSILICHLHERKKLLQRLGACLGAQVIGREKEVEILVEADDRRLSTGEKRNKLLDRATGEYVCAVDDDDLLSDDYIEKILKALETRPDVIGMEGTLFRKNQEPRRFVHSIKYSKWAEEGKVYVRMPNHLNPVRRELALCVKFLPKNIGEDHDYSQRLYPLLKTEVAVEGSIYHYFA